MTPIPSLRDPELAVVWDSVRSRLERTVPGARGRLALPELTIHGRLVMKGLLGSAPGRTIDLRLLEARLQALGVGADLEEALAAIGHPVSDEPARRRADRRSAAAARTAARAEVAAWDEPWAGPWVDGAVAAGLLSGLDADEAVTLLRDVNSVLDRIDRHAGEADRLSRVDLAANVLGSAHGLDPGTRQEGLVTRALQVRFPDTSPGQAWEAAGVLPDLVSAPALTWGLRPVDGSPLAGLLAGAAGLGVPLHISQLALRRYPLTVDPSTVVLVSENPRVVEAAAQGGHPRAAVALNGNPSGAVRLLVHQLLESGAELRYHGDFDAAGLRICARMHRWGLRPWRMAAADYLAALSVADEEGASLPVDPYRAPPTPWDEGLAAAFDAERRIVHEERLLAMLLDDEVGDR